MASGLSDTKPKYHWDLYALFVAPQEVFFGHETQVNLSLIERAELPDGTERIYLSPTKRRGVERRALLYAPVHKNGESKFLTDLLDCGIPGTCGKEECPICRVYGALITDSKGGKERTTFIGRLTHGGGVGVPALGPSEKQRAMHPSDLRRGGEQEPQPFKREYGAPGLVFPVYNHVLAASEEEFLAIAYAFLESLPRLGAGNPKGLALLEDADGPYLVLDRYLSPMGKRVVVDPLARDGEREDPSRHLERVKREFRALSAEFPHDHPRFTRWHGEAALQKLQAMADAFVASLERYWG